MNESIISYVLINAYASIVVAVKASLRGKSVYKYFFLSMLFSSVVMYVYLIVTARKVKTNNY